MRYYTKDPNQMVFSSFKASNLFFDNLSSLYGEAEDKDLITLINEKNNKFLEEDNNNFYYTPVSYDSIDYEGLPDRIAYDIEQLATYFTSAFDDSFYNTGKENQNLPSFSERNKQIIAFTIAVEHGANIEILKTKLAKILLNQRLEINEHIASYKSKDKNITIDQIKASDRGLLNDLLIAYRRTYLLLIKAEGLSKGFSPYEELFQLGEKLIKLKEEYSKSEYNKEKYDKIRDLEKSIQQEYSEFDPELLMDVSKYRKEYFINKTTEKQLSEDGSLNPNISNDSENSSYCQSADFIYSCVNKFIEKQSNETKSF